MSGWEIWKFISALKRSGNSGFPPIPVWQEVKRRQEGDNIQHPSLLAEKKAVALLLVRLSPSHEENEITFDNDWWASHEYICYWKWKSLLNLILMSNMDGGHRIFVQWQQRGLSLCCRLNIHKGTSILIQQSCFGPLWWTVYLEVDQKLGLRRWSWQ